MLLSSKNSVADRRPIGAVVTFEEQPLRPYELRCTIAVNIDVIMSAGPLQIDLGGVIGICKGSPFYRHFLSAFRNQSWITGWEFLDQGYLGPISHVS